MTRTVCKRCGRELTVNGCPVCSRRDQRNASKRVELVRDSSVPAWTGEAGNVDVRLVAIVAAVTAAALVVVLAWHYLLAGGVLYAAYRHLTRQTRRRRPKSSWASLSTSLAALYASWNSRGLVRRNGRVLRVSVPAKAGLEHVDQYGPVDEIPF